MVYWTRGTLKLLIQLRWGDHSHYWYLSSLGDSLVSTLFLQIRRLLKMSKALFDTLTITPLYGLLSICTSGSVRITPHIMQYQAAKIYPNSIKNKMAMRLKIEYASGTTEYVLYSVGSGPCTSHRHVAPPDFQHLKILHPGCLLKLSTTLNAKLI